MGHRIRSATPFDLLPLSAPPAATLRLNLVQQLLFPYRPLRGMLSSWLRLRGPSQVLLCWGDGGLLASAQAWPGPGSSSLEVRYLAVWRAALEEALGLWGELLTRLGAEAGREQITRLLVRLPDEDYLDLFQQAGFSPFAEEMILLWDGSQQQDVQMEPVLHPVRSDHLWAIQQLHLSLTPPLVQQAEGYTSDCWRPRGGEEGWVWQEEGRARAYLRRRRGPLGTGVDLLLDPAVRQYGQVLLAQGLQGADPPVYLILRSYQGELLEVAYRLGFRPFAEQILLGKYLAVRQEQHQAVTARKAEHQLGAAPTTPSVGNST